MSKIGKKNIAIPKESSIKVEGSNLIISGPKGTKKLTINDKIFSSKVNEAEFQIEPLQKKIDKKKEKNKEKKKKDPSTAKIVAKPKCDSKVRIKAIVTAQYQQTDPAKWKRTWKVKNNTGPGC